MCSSVRPSRSTCLRAAAVSRSRSAASTTRAAMLVSAVKVVDFRRPHATASSTSSTAVPAVRSACATASRTTCSTSCSSNTVPLFTPREGHTPVPSTRTSTCFRFAAARDCGTATMTHTVLLVPMSSNPKMPSARLLVPRFVRTQHTPTPGRLTPAQLPPVTLRASGPIVSLRPCAARTSVRCGTRTSISPASGPRALATRRARSIASPSP